MIRKKAKKKRRGIILHKPSGTIAIAGDLTLAQRRLYNIFIHTAQEEWTQQEKTEQGIFFTVSLPNVKKTYKVPITNQKWLIEAVKSLVSTYAHFNILGKDSKMERDRIFSLLSEVRISSTNGVVKSIKFMFPPTIYEAIKGVLEGKRTYANLDLSAALSLKTKYSENLYEICKDYEGVVEKKLTIEEFRRLFGIENKYKKIVDVKRWVLDPAIKEINNNPLIDFLVEYELIKEGNRYGHIKFLIKPKPQEVKIVQQVEDYKSLAKNEDLDALLSLIPEQYRNRKTCINLLLGALKKKDKEYVKEQIKYTNQKNPTKNYCAYLKKALENDYAGYEIVEIDSTDNIEPEPAEFIGKAIIMGEYGYFIQSIEKGKYKNREGYIVSLLTKNGEKEKKIFVTNLSRLKEMLL